MAAAMAMAMAMAMATAPATAMATATATATAPATAVMIGNRPRGEVPCGGRTLGCTGGLIVLHPGNRDRIGGYDGEKGVEPGGRGATHAPRGAPPDNPRR